MRLLDLFCGAGGAAVGYHRAGFTEIVGVDNRAQPRYPFNFVEGDALEYLATHGREFDAIHASPPCQAYSWSAKRWKDVERTDLVAPTKELLVASGRLFVMENVIGSPLLFPVRLCGVMFGLGVIRHRLFESNMCFFVPAHPAHRGTVKDGTYVTVAGHGGHNIRGRGSRKAKQEAMGIDWMNDKELNEAIPPAYTELMGRQLLNAIPASARRTRAQDVA